MGWWMAAFPVDSYWENDDGAGWDPTIAELTLKVGSIDKMKDENNIHFWNWLGLKESDNGPLPYLIKLDQFKFFMFNLRRLPDSDRKSYLFSFLIDIIDYCEEHNLEAVGFTIS